MSGGRIAALVVAGLAAALAAKVFMGESPAPIGEPRTNVWGEPVETFRLISMVDWNEAMANVIAYNLDWDECRKLEGERTRAIMRQQGGMKTPDGKSILIECQRE